MNPLPTQTATRTCGECERLSSVGTCLAKAQPGRLDIYASRRCLEFCPLWGCRDGRTGRELWPELPNTPVPQHGSDVGIQPYQEVGQPPDPPTVHTLRNGVDKVRHEQAHKVDAVAEAKRQRWREYHELCRLIREHGSPRPCPPFPYELRDMQCGARTRAGTPCKQTAIYENGRCKWHGGLATGPRTEAGKDQSRINGRRGGRPRKPKSCR